MAAHAHRGVAFVEVLLNCVTFHDGAYQLITGKDSRAEHSLRLQTGAPMRFGRDDDRWLCSDNGRIVVRQSATAPADALILDPQAPDPGLAQQLALMTPPVLPCALGIFRQVQAPVLAEAAA